MARRLWASQVNEKMAKRFFAQMKLVPWLKSELIVAFYLQHKFEITNFNKRLECYQHSEKVIIKRREQNVK